MCTAKKIGLIAPYKSTNYGTLLQAYALARKISELGGKCEYVDYTPYYKRTIWERVVRKFKRIMHIPIDKEKVEYEGIDDFRFLYSKEFAPLQKSSRNFSEQNIPHSQVCYNVRNIHSCLKKYERFIVGSDQTWSLENYYGTKGFYMLPFVKRHTKCYAYAPSLGTTFITEEHAKILRRRLKIFDLVSCREKKNCYILSKLIGKEVHFVVDPTMLYTGDAWRKIADYSNLPEKYIMAYILGEKDCISKFAEEIGKKEGIPVFYVCTRPKYTKKKYHFPMNLSPEQWVAALDRATCVVTDSFHGSLFSINLGTDFYVFTKRDEVRNNFNDNDRINELLGTFDLKERLVKDNYENVDFCPIDFIKIQEKVNELRCSSIIYLQSILS